MAADLDEIRARLQHCRVEIAALRRQIEEWGATAIINWRVPLDHAAWAKPPPVYAIHALQNHPPPTAFQAKAGMLANELRACLDGLAIRATGSDKDTYFPISKTAEIFKVDGRRKMKRLSDSDQNKIASLEPYGGGHPELFALHEVDRVRKHRHLVASEVCCAVAFGLNESLVAGGCEDIKINLPVVDGQTVLTGAIFVRKTRFPAIGAEIKVVENCPWHLPVRFFPVLMFQEPDELRSTDVQTRLDDFASTVDEVVAMFE